MKRARHVGSLVSALAILLAAGAARADDGADADSGSSFGMMVTIGAGLYFVDGGVYRAPLSLELVPSIGWSWVRLDFGLVTTLESVEIAETHIGDWTFTFRPGARLKPPLVPFYLRVAFPLQFQEHDFDWGVMFGAGIDIPVGPVLGLVLELDTTLTNNLEWGGRGLPIELRAGLSLTF